MAIHPVRLRLHQGEYEALQRAASETGRTYTDLLREAWRSHSGCDAEACPSDPQT
jgi:uncharacterized protein (DUF1778 family)